VLYLPQSPERMFFAETVREEVLFGLKRLRTQSKGDGDAFDSVVRASLEAAGLDSAAFIDRSPFELSVGEMRRVAFAIAHALEPELLLLDEPATSLDAAGRGALRRLVDARLDAGAAVVVASHDRSHLEALCDRMLELEAGRIAAV
jgi:energy-coupling factor transporter ATP-binding protein EcfA2